MSTRPPPDVATKLSNKCSSLHILVKSGLVGSGRVGSGPCHIKPVNSLSKPPFSTHFLFEGVRELVDADPKDNLASAPGHEAANPTPVDGFGVRLRIARLLEHQDGRIWAPESQGGMIANSNAKQDAAVSSVPYDRSVLATTVNFLVEEKRSLKHRSPRKTHPVYY